MLRSGRSAVLLLLPLFLTLLPSTGGTVAAQQGYGIPLQDPPLPTVRNADIYCAGFISEDPVKSPFEIIGAEREDESREFATTSVVFINYGARDGATPGETLYVLRPRGKYENPFTGKDIGYYTEELGMVRILAVQRKVSTAEVITSCEPIRLGDVLRKYDAYVPPYPRRFEPLPRYSLPSGLLSGQIVLARNFRSFLAARDIVYVDIGARQGVEIGQYYTIYRTPSEEEGVLGVPDITAEEELSMNRDDEYDTDRLPRGDFSLLYQRRNYPDILEERDGLPRKVVGELQIIRIEGTAATGVITRTTQEVNVGDFIELQP